jgi:hypothetical protein
LGYAIVIAGFMKEEWSYAVGEFKYFAGQGAPPDGLVARWLMGVGAYDSLGEREGEYREIYKEANAFIDAWDTHKIPPTRLAEAICPGQSTTTPQEVTPDDSRTPPDVAAQHGE